MGFSKYFEDIQKIRDHAASLRDSRLDRRSVTVAPEKAIQELLRLQRTINLWSEHLVDKLDEILDLATDPEIKRENTIENLQVTIAEQRHLLHAYLAKIASSSLQIEELTKKIECARHDLEINQKLNRKSGEALLSHRKDFDRLSQRNSALEAEIANLRRREKEAGDFNALMRREGVRLHNKLRSD